MSQAMNHALNHEHAAYRKIFVYGFKSRVQLAQALYKCTDVRVSMGLADQNRVRGSVHKTNAMQHELVIVYGAERTGTDSFTTILPFHQLYSEKKKCSVCIGKFLFITYFTFASQRS